MEEEWPEDLPIEQKAFGTQAFQAKKLYHYNSDTSEKISLYYLKQGYSIIDTFEKTESFRNCSFINHGPVEDSHCSHSHSISNITKSRKYHILKNKTI